MLGLVGFVCGALAGGPQHKAARPRVPVALVKGVNAFADDLLREFGRKGQDENLLFSPLSIATAMGMVYGGAKGQTAEEIRRTMHFPEDAKQTHGGFRLLSGTLNMQAKSYHLRTVNALFPQQGYEILASFQALLKTDYRAGGRRVDFAGNPAGAADVINAWIKRQTGGRIANMLSPDDLDADTRLVLGNAVYFKADWAYCFIKDATEPEPFRPLRGKPYPVNMMHQTHEFLYLDAPLVQVVELPYKGHRHSLIILLPKKPKGLAEVEKRFVESTIQVNLDRLLPRLVRLSLPRFEIDQPTIDLRPLLQSLGAKRLFDPNQAELGGMSAEPGLHIDFALHKAWIRVDEEGTEATASTMMSAGGLGLEEHVPKTIVFRADHPFLFALRDRATNALLFLGRVAQPTKAETEH
jgi:serpin B